MRIDEDLASLVRQHPDLGETAELILRLRNEGERLPLVPFAEPVSATIVGNGKYELLAVGPADLASWTRHIAATTLCRTHCLETPVIANLVEPNILATMVLLRSHFETAALATYCLQELTESARNHDPKKLREIIPKTLFGTALKKHRERDVVSELLTMTEGATVRISHAVDAMDNYYYREAAEGKLAVVYSLLCEVSHPNHRSALDFMQAAERPDGWLVTYQRDPFENAERPKYALEVLLVSMRSGYASAEMLRCWGFSGREESTIRWEPPTMSDHSRISVDLLQGPHS